MERLADEVLRDPHVVEDEPHRLEFLGAERVGRADGESIDVRAVETGHVHGGAHRLGEHTTAGRVEGDSLVARSDVRAFPTLARSATRPTTRPATP